MYVTREELKVEVRTLMGEIRTAAKDLGGEITNLYNDIEGLKETIKLQQELINKLYNLLDVEE